MIEGRRAERQARERSLVYRLGAMNKVTKRTKQKNTSWPLMAANQQKNTQQSTKNSGRDGGDYGGEARRAGGAGEVGYHRFDGIISLKRGKKLKQIIEIRK